MKDGKVLTMDSSYDHERRAFLKAMTATTAALATGACGGPAPMGSSAPATGGNQAPPANRPPVWLTVPTITFTQGIASSSSIAGYVSDPNGDALTITRTDAIALPAGVTYDAAGKRFVYDGVGAVGSTGGHVLTADDGKP